MGKDDCADKDRKRSLRQSSLPNFWEKGVA